MSIKIEYIETSGWEAAIRGMRNPKNSWNKSDSQWCGGRKLEDCEKYEKCHMEYCVGENDLKLMSILAHAGPEHGKYLRMIHVQMDITAPTFWWAEFDTYKVGTTRDSCSKMHKIHVKPFELDDFAHEACMEIPIAHDALLTVIDACEQLRLKFNETQERKYWRALIELLPEGYMMKATWDGSLQTVLSILHQRNHHKLGEEWKPFREAMFTYIPYCTELYTAIYGNKGDDFLKETNND